MAFNTDDFQAPEELRTDEFLLRPIRASDAELDYEALMQSKAFLRLWEQSSWPTDDFTVEANRDDLARHEREHMAGESFTYTVMNPSVTHCLGCVYIFPTTAPMFSRPRIVATDGAQWAEYEAAVYFWIRTSRLSDGLDGRLLAALGPWLEHEWRIEHPLIITNEQVEQQVATIERSHRQLKFQLTFPNEPGTSLAFA